MGPRSRVLGRLPADAGGALPSQVVSGAGSGDGEHLRRSGRPQCGHKRPRGLQAEGGWTHTEGRSGGDGQGRDAGSLPQRLEEARRAFSPEGPEQVVQEGVGVARDGGRGRKGRGGMGGRTKPCGASEGPALARRELEGLRGRAIKAALGPRKTCLRIPGVPADCWRWHPVPQHLCCAPGPRRAPPPSLPPTLPKDRQGGTQLDVGFLEDVSRFLTSAAHGMCAGELSM